MGDGVKALLRPLRTPLTLFGGLRVGEREASFKGLLLPPFHTSDFFSQSIALGLLKPICQGNWKSLGFSSPLTCDR